MTTITPEIRQAIEQAGDEPVRLLDPMTNIQYVLIKAPNRDDELESIVAMYPLLADLDPEDWEDPSEYGL